MLEDPRWKGPCMCVVFDEKCKLWRVSHGYTCEMLIVLHEIVYETKKAQGKFRTKESLVYSSFWGRPAVTEGMVNGSFKLLRVGRVICRRAWPPIHMIKERSREKLSLQQNQLTVWLCLVAVIETNFLYTTLAVSPIPPETEKTRGEKCPCSTSLMCWSSAHFFSYLCYL